jgi:hypothetical protein
MAVTLMLSGDALERHFARRLRGLFTRYEEVWRAIVVPLRVPGDIQLRLVDPNIEWFAMSHYSMYCYLGMASEYLAQAPERPYWYDDVFVHLQAARDLYREVLVSLTQIWGKAFAHLDDSRSALNHAINDLSPDSSDFDKKLAKDDLIVRSYRDAMAHDPRLGQRISNGHLLVPHHRHLPPKRMKQPPLLWSAIKSLPDTEMVRLDEMARSLLDRTLVNINGRWKGVGAAMLLLPANETYQQMAMIGKFSPYDSEPEPSDDQWGDTQTLSFQTPPTGGISPANDLDRPGFSMLSWLLWSGRGISGYIPPDPPADKST